MGQGPGDPPRADRELATRGRTHPGTISIRGIVTSVRGTCPRPWWTLPSRPGDGNVRGATRGRGAAGSGLRIPRSALRARGVRRRLRRGKGPRMPAGVRRALAAGHPRRRTEGGEIALGNAGLQLRRIEAA